MPSRKIVQCRMSSVQGAVNTRPPCTKRVFFKEYLIETETKVISIVSNK